MLKRVVSLIPVLFVVALVVAKEPSHRQQYQSPFMRVELAQDQPAFVALAVDSLGKNKLSVSPLQPLARPAKEYELSGIGSRFEYRPVGAPSGAPFEFLHFLSGCVLSALRAVGCVLS